MADRLLLVVEGPDDKHVFWAILNHHQFAPLFEIRDEGGFETLIKRMSVHLKSGLKSGVLLKSTKPRL
jgi:hypothetical protein